MERALIDNIILQAWWWPEKTAETYSLFNQL